MPATFAHGLIAKRAIDVLSTRAASPFAGALGEHNEFVVMGAAGPDYPYLTDILTTSVLQIGHTWANRMHYEGVYSFVKEGISALAALPDDGEPFAIRLAWFCGYVSHIIADAYVHPVINSIVGGPYIFTHREHGTCELIQDIYIFKMLTGNDIINSNPRGGPFGYLDILDEGSDPQDKDRIHPEVRNFWTDLLTKAHPHATDYLDGIDPDKWHYNYKGRVNFVVDPSAIFRHILGMTGFSYKKASDITPGERTKYIDNLVLPNGSSSKYDSVFDNAVKRVVDVWMKIFDDIQKKSTNDVVTYIREWNLDTGVDENRIDLWSKGA